MPPSECRESVGGATQQENRSSSKCAHHRTVSDCGNNLTTVIVQTVVGAKAGDYSFLTGLLNAERARKLRWNSNPGDVIELLVASLGLDYSPDGTKIMKRGHQQDVALHAQPLACPTSRKPALQGRATTISMLASLSLEHEADTCASGGSRAAQAAAEAARPPPLRSLTRVAPSASDKFTTRLGTGWGHHPRQRALRCIAEEHHARCGPITGMVESTDGAYWSCHQVGVVGAFRFVCAQGCCINWSSAERLPGAPAKTTVPHNMGTAQPMIAVSCSVDDNPTSSGERMQQEPPTAVNPKQLQEEFRRAVAHQERTRSLFSLASLWQEMELQTRAAVEVARRYLARESEHPKDASVIEAVHAWVGKNRAPLTQTRGAGLRPADYKVNLDVYSDALLCGECKEELTDKYSWKCVMRCDYDCCEHCYVRGLDAVVPS